MGPTELAALIRRPATRRFDSARPVGQESIAAIVEAARWTGSARNRQPWRFVEVRSRDVLRRLADGWVPRHVLALGHPAPRDPVAGPRHGTSAVPVGRLDVREILITIPES